MALEETEKYHRLDHEKKRNKTGQLGGRTARHIQMEEIAPSIHCEKQRNTTGKKKNSDGASAYRKFPEKEQFLPQASIVNEGTQR